MSLQIVRSVAELRAVLRPVRLSERSIGLVPTMGAFHDGHRSLMQRAAECNDLVVVSLFVNPTQFGRDEDLSKYPRNEARDAAIAEAAGVDVLFAPPVEEVYPDGHATSISVGGVTDSLEGAHRPGHFDGVATVVAKLFNMVQPDVAYFGQKDAQQALVIRKLVRDLDIPVRVEICPTVREADGLAMSSRNAYLDDHDRIQAVALRRALDAAERVVERGERDAEQVSAAARAVLAEHAIEPEYVALVGPETLTPVQRVDGEVLMALAARVGPARLIDNTILSAPDATPEPAA
ncbi:pantoate--beta-alanine ligase [Conexibacter sp. JD483]|uniref:pantoate--beta-alanine ligase n=1 Tax=unclassified Conexibacter TaxID=2627773 RepID=UPI0027232F1A|nr:MULTISPECIES: pantoate--beta-alanine ligase [unclassified Conexibacter]MDO8184841.1 pantoate--beta-alanine ligase [Conexibacter sp. CPCC 205706]MDO8196616.1 pantoate--beta-alanine ligase [Conexibacter sp. CPCC 205762]MDR9368671.1 pantoate--beta-alanine ligase [Conexibacter sp. JD483]